MWFERHLLPIGGIMVDPQLGDGGTGFAFTRADPTVDAVFNCAGATTHPVDGGLPALEERV